MIRCTTTFAVCVYVFLVHWPQSHVPTIVYSLPLGKYGDREIWGNVDQMWGQAERILKREDEWN